MGSPLSPILANIFKEKFEDNGISTSPFRPFLWCRYIDGDSTLWPHTQLYLLQFRTNLNKRNISIQFSTEEERNNKLSFLDFEIEWENDHFIRSTYRMKTHNDHYLNYKSNHVPRILSGVVKCLSSRATFFCYSALLDKELVHLKKVLSCLMAILYQLLIKTSIETENQKVSSITDESKLLVLPYIKSICETIEWICCPLSSN